MFVSTILHPPPPPTHTVTHTHPCLGVWLAVPRLLHIVSSRRRLSGIMLAYHADNTLVIIPIHTARPRGDAHRCACAYWVLPCGGRQLQIQTHSPLDSISSCNKRSLSAYHVAFDLIYRYTHTTCLFPESYCLFAIACPALLVRRFVCS